MWAVIVCVSARQTEPRWTTSKPLSVLTRVPLLPATRTLTPLMLQVVVALTVIGEDDQVGTSFADAHYRRLIVGDGVVVGIVCRVVNRVVTV
ncbi:MAG: hypothetical protein U0105_15455 [Candidatus Obscuribacterales bacterium]